MASGQVAGVPGLTPRMAAAAMTMAIARREPNYYIAGFAAGQMTSMRRQTAMACDVAKRAGVAASGSGCLPG